jgi:DNA-binding NtrC family response regulator
VSKVAGLHILIAEDETLVSMLLEEMLADLECTVIGTASNLDEVMSSIGTAERLDVAILDVNLGGQPIEPAVEALKARGTPYLFITGYGAASVNDRFAGAPVLQKPFQMPMLERALAPFAAKP